MDSHDRHLDGNATAGLLAEIFGREMTTAHAICGGCGVDTPVGGLLDYDPGLGSILRCPACDAALIRVSRVRSGYWLDMRGASVLRIQSEG
jgi:hypothetical protein